MNFKAPLNLLPSPNISTTDYWNKYGSYLVQYLETIYIPSNIEGLIIERSGGKILEVDIRYPLKIDD